MDSDDAINRLFELQREDRERILMHIAREEMIKAQLDDVSADVKALVLMMDQGIGAVTVLKWIGGSIVVIGGLAGWAVSMYFTIKGGLK